MSDRGLSSQVANLWDVSVAPTIVLVLARPRIRRIQSVKYLHAAVTVQTKTGVRRDFQVLDLQVTSLYLQ